ncbi:ADP-ribosylglycohydrolase family protein [Euhalothece natronophila Z-M001]|uniref:ADP-ribosylglycohydrolase family protein n=1 Tax=Euhalothece natronophila Z-M001 TaxID=522448 RepID=A0A5B8NNZ6_9CHRO|nr:ADP-ribosylglycohydrolase family protein [Euhalothece natronophila]QDZ40677.1 ADP-ribosylglycohydrolase family protein [Euhalothece natronophila Z-M001]
MVLGAIAGDIIGSIYESPWNNIKTKSFPLFQSESRFTDDTVLTVAVADAILNNQSYIIKLKEYYHRYPNAGFGGNFRRWAASDNTEPYYSFGNGSAMRVSPVAYAFSDLETVKNEALKSAAVTHNHPEGIKGAQAIAMAIFLARSNISKAKIQEKIKEFCQYDLNLTVSELQKTYCFDLSCQGSVPQAIICFLEATDFEDAIRNAISIGGDSDTLACMTGAIAEAFYQEIPEGILKETYQRLDGHLKTVIEDFKQQYL